MAIPMEAGSSAAQSEILASFRFASAFEKRMSSPHTHTSKTHTQQRFESDRFAQKITIHKIRKNFEWGC